MPLFTKMLRKNNKLSPLKGSNNFYLPLKCFLYFGWTVGIFPINFDRNLTTFKYKIFSFSTLFSFLRLIFFYLLFNFLTLIPDEMIYDTPENMTDATENISSYHQASSTRDVALAFNNVFPVLSMVFNLEISLKHFLFRFAESIFFLIKLGCFNDIN